MTSDQNAFPGGGPDRPTMASAVPDPAWTPAWATPAGTTAPASDPSLTRSYTAPAPVPDPTWASPTNPPTAPAGWVFVPGTGWVPAPTPPPAPPVAPPGWVLLPGVGWVQAGVAGHPDPAWSAAPAPATGAWSAAPTAPPPMPSAMIPGAWGMTASAPNLMPGAALPAPAPEPAMPADRRSSGRRPSTYAVAIVVAALLCAGGVGFAVGRMSAPVAPTAVNGFTPPTGFTPGQGFPDTQAAQPSADPGADTTTGDTTTAAASPGTPGSGMPDPAGGVPGGGFPGGGFPGGGFGGFGLTGTVTAVTDGGLTIQTQDGSTRELTTDATTTYHQEQPASAADVVVGAQVRVTTSGGLPGRGGVPGGATASPAAGGTATITASDVLLLAQ